jgi:hypothetical protein
VVFPARRTPDRRALEHRDSRRARDLSPCRGKRVASIFAKLGLAPSENDNRRVIAAINYLES